MKNKEDLLINNQECSIESIFTDKLINRFYAELKFQYVSEIINEERVLRELKGLYVKNVFNAMGSRLRALYDLQYAFVQKLKKEYGVKYGS